MNSHSSIPIAPTNHGQNLNFNPIIMKIGQKVTYRQGSSVYTGTLVKISDHELVIIDDDYSAWQLHNAGYAVGSCVSLSQIIL